MTKIRVTLAGSNSWRPTCWDGNPLRIWAVWALISRPPTEYPLAPLLLPLSTVLSSRLHLFITTSDRLEGLFLPTSPSFRPLAVDSRQLQSIPLPFQLSSPSFTEHPVLPLHSHSRPPSFLKHRFSNRPGVSLAFSLLHPPSFGPLDDVVLVEPDPIRRISL